MGFRAKTLLISLAIVAGVLTLWVWAVRPPLIYSDWLGLSPVPEASPMSRLRDWGNEINAPRTPSGCVSLFETGELIIPGLLIFALMMLVTLPVLSRFDGWKRALATSPIRMAHAFPLWIRVRTAIAAIAVLGLYLGWEIDAWRVWRVRTAYRLQAMEAASREQSALTQLRSARADVLKIENYLSQRPNLDAEEGSHRSSSSLAAERAAFEYRSNRLISDLQARASLDGELVRKYERAAANPRVAVTPDPPPPDPLPSKVTLQLPGGTIPSMLELADEMAGKFPDYVEAHLESARIRSTCPNAQYRDGRRAIASATRACELTDWKDTEALMTLAAAHAEAKEFAEAVKWQGKVVEMNANSPNPAFFTDRLKLYKSGKPFRER